jgi:hypothetical protein
MTAATMKRDKLDPAIDDLKDRFDGIDLSALDLPRLQVLGRRADEAIDKVTGRNQRRLWPWVLAGLAIVGIAGVVTTMVLSTWGRNRTEAWPDEATESLDRMSENGLATGLDSSDIPGEQITTGITAAEGSLMSYDPLEGRGA